ncbi:hypothetical protein WBJ53_07195 [Spirosoma sp. SC4-14]|uniref:hypothetical protein n=1 Tax=Spirosoma sp. SC4-14 TaxID=3128900 RepID=UPI0030CC1148
MMSRPVILTLLWLAYAFMLVHDLIPHHHDQEGSVAHREQNARFDKQTTPKSGWWFAHVHVPGQTMYQDEIASPNAPQSLVAIVPASIRLYPMVLVHLTNLFLGWPPTRANAPPGLYRFRPLRAPPTSFFFA